MTDHVTPTTVESRDALERLADEQATLRRIATLVAKGAPPEQVFAAVADETATTFRAMTAVLRFDHDTSGVVFVGASNEAGIPIGTRWELTDGMSSTEVHRTGRPARRGAVDWAADNGPMAEAAHRLGIVSQVSCPIVVEGRPWGVITVTAREELPPDTEERLQKFTELVTTAIANADSRGEVERLVDQQTALRRVATLVAEGAAPADVFTAVAWEVAQLFDFAAVTISRYDGDAVVVLTDPLDSGFPVGSRWPMDGDSLALRVHATGQMARIDDYTGLEGSIAGRMRERESRSAIGVPIVVEGGLWGILCVGAAASELLPADTEARIAGFVELVGSAIANSQARDGLRLLADEQAALRRVATLVARGAPSKEVFDAVATEVGTLLDIDITVVGRFDRDGAATAIGSWSASPGGVPVGTRSKVGGRNVLTTVWETGKPARIDGYDDASGEAADIARNHGWRSSIAAPIVVEDHLWGVVLVATQRPEPFAVDAEERLAAFTDLVATAIANAESRAELAASRRRIVAASDETRRQIERDLHDGTQQRLVSLGLALRAVEVTVPPEQGELRARLAEVADGLAGAVEDLQEISRGIHPAILSKGGLRPALRALAHRSAIPVNLDITAETRLAESIEVAAYFVASEALANAAKHSQASRIDVWLAERDGRLLLTVRDDGVGGADPAGGSGLIGLTDRVEALGGSISVESRPRSGTQITAELPVEPELPPAAG